MPYAGHDVSGVNERDKRLGWIDFTYHDCVLLLNIAVSFMCIILSKTYKQTLN